MTRTWGSTWIKRGDRVTEHHKATPIFDELLHEFRHGKATSDGENSADTVEHEWPQDHRGPQGPVRPSEMFPT
jgi:hypothetical protein